MPITAPPVVWAGSTADDPVGCGPYKLKAQERGTYIEVERFDGFYEKGRPLSDTIRFIAYPDENLRYAALTTGDVDLIEYLPWAQFDAVSKSTKLKMASTTGPFMLLLFNVSKGGPFADPKVRQAIGYAVKRQDVIDAAFAGHGTPLLGFPNPEGSPFKLSDPAAEWSFDPAKAKAMLAEAGYGARLLLQAPRHLHLRHAPGHRLHRAGLPPADRHQRHARPAGLGEPREGRQGRRL